MFVMEILKVMVETMIRFVQLESLVPAESPKSVRECRPSTLSLGQHLDNPASRGTPSKEDRLRDDLGTVKPAESPSNVVEAKEKQHKDRV